ncbi:hypothetical protein F0562_025047 [Nyssa sinensis]|uniref:Uncharacterized protein n=1 Tax=Nyssa sinensis TaxID=561372 RepID=A0A5J5BEE7_9ASTE|nr:hypothetical protein F0562_025047 [Nyssa sinensis]
MQIAWETLLEGSVEDNELSYSLTKAWREDLQKQLEVISNQLQCTQEGCKYRFGLLNCGFIEGNIYMICPNQWSQSKTLFYDIVYVNGFEKSNFDEETFNEDSADEDKKREVGTVGATEFQRRKCNEITNQLYVLVL